MNESFLEKRIGPLRVRAYGLVVNFIANVCALYGLSGYLTNGSGLGFLIAGGLGTIAMIWILSKPA
ncbi:MAG: hypothetical protein AAGL49_12500 [Pseudomonadota bacterium]